MIIVKVQGGLGNQLMQYSIGRVLAKQLEQEVLYDISFFKENTKYTKRSYLLDVFNTEVHAASEEEIFRVRYPYGKFSKGINLFFRAINKFFLKRYYIGYESRFIPFVRGKVGRGKDVYLEGFWQSYLYYHKNIQDLATEITLKDTDKLLVFKQQSSFDFKVSVSVHIRRGDFLNKNAGTKIVEKEYYERAVPLLEQKVSNPTYYVFSDDIEWVKQEMGHLFKDAIYVSSFGLPDYIEFALLKECKHAILSNSTFCWFATLLTNNKNKVVIYPKDWKNKYLNKSSDICPPEWIGLE